MAIAKQGNTGFSDTLINLHELCEKFIRDQRITSADTVAQCDRVIINAYEFITEICDIVGYLEIDEDE